MTGFAVLKDENVSYLDQHLLDEKGLLKVVSADLLKSFPIRHIQLWGNKNGVYCFPTTELIEWLKMKIAKRKAIEICAGNGAISRALGISGTDSYIQTTPEMIAYYQIVGQKPIDPPDDIYKFEANEAVDHFKPQVVVAAYGTQKYIVGDEGPPKIGSSVYGIDELLMLPKIQTYINIGNDVSHHDKRIRKYLFEFYRFDWLFTRSLDQSKNHICLWNN